MKPFLLLAVLMLVGCKSYEYDVIQPQPALHVGTKQFVSTELSPLRYEMITVEDYLVMQIRNPTDRSVSLLPDKSYIIDQRGQSRSVNGLTIAPGSFIKLIFPPPRPYVRDEGGFRFGVGTGIDTSGGFGTRLGTGYGGGGTSSVRNLDENYYWPWEGEGTVKFHFVFSDGKENFDHDLVIERKRS